MLPNDPPIFLQIPENEIHTTVDSILHPGRLKFLFYNRPDKERSHGQTWRELQAQKLQEFWKKRGLIFPVN